MLHCDKKPPRNIFPFNYLFVDLLIAQNYIL